MDKDKNELLYVMNLLKASPKKEASEISKEFSSFTINKKWQFNIKPDSKFETLNNNKNYLMTNNNSKTIQQNETINKNESLIDKEDSSINPFFQKQNTQSINQKTSTLFQNYKPNLNIRKFSNIPKTSTLTRDNKWFNNNNFNNI